LFLPVPSPACTNIDERDAILVGEGSKKREGTPPPLSKISPLSNKQIIAWQSKELFERETGGEPYIQPKSNSTLYVSALSPLIRYVTLFN